MNILDIEEIQFLNESEVVSKTLLKWHKARPDNKELQDVIDAYTKVFLALYQYADKSKRIRKAVIRNESS